MMIVLDAVGEIFKFTDIEMSYPYSSTFMKDFLFLFFKKPS